MARSPTGIGGRAASSSTSVCGYESERRRASVRPKPDVPAIRVRIGGSNEPVAIVARLGVLHCPRFRKWYMPILEVDDPRFRTSDGIGVGSTLQEAEERAWAGAEGQPTGRALDDATPNSALIQFIYHPLRGECEGCPPPDRESEVAMKRLMLPFPRMQQTRCAELRP